MSAKYDWHAEEEHGWNLPGEILPETPSRRPRDRRLRRVLTAAVVLALALVSVRLLVGYVGQAAVSTEEEVLTSHGLILSAAREQDAGILASFISGKDPDWTQVQLALLDQGLALQNEAFQLFWQPAAEVAAPTVEMSADLREAVVLADLQYELVDGSDSRVSAIFTRPMVYRRSEDRWLLSPPVANFWGVEQVSEGRYVSVVYPERDAPIAGRLAADMESAIGLACSQLPDLTCPDGLHLVVVLSTDPSVQLAMSEPAYRITQNPEIHLPAPSLVGLPVNETGYRLLLRGYNRFVLSRLLAGLTGVQCCPGAVYSEALVDRQLATLGIQAWPLRPSDYRLGLVDGSWMSYLEGLWTEQDSPVTVSEPDQRRLAYSFIEFLDLQGSELSTTQLQRLLARSDSFQEWLAMIQGSPQDVTALEVAWKGYLRQRSSAN